MTRDLEAENARLIDLAKRERARESAGIGRIEELLGIPEDERGFDYGTINRAIESMFDALTGHKAENAKFRSALTTIRQNIGLTRAECGQIAQAALSPPSAGEQSAAEPTMGYEELWRELCEKEAEALTGLSRRTG